MNINLKALEGIRGLAALYVLIHHSRTALTQSYNSGLKLYPEQYEWYDKLMVYFFSLFKFGHEAVIVFFVLSGFVIHLKQTKPSYSYPNFNWKNYFKKRLIRIYPPFLASMILCVLRDYVLTLIDSVEFAGIFDKYTINSLINNLLLIPGTEPWGYNYPSWSLKHEWVFYILYPFVLYLNHNNFKITILIILGLYISYLLGYSIPFIGEVAYTFVVWNFGVLIAHYYNKQDFKYFKYFPLFIIITVIYVPTYALFNSYAIKDILFGLIMAGFLSFLLITKNKLVLNSLNKLTWLGAFSYSIYILHYPLLNLYQSLFYYINHTNKLPYHLWHVVIFTLISLPLIYLIYYFTERFAINYKKTLS